MTAIWCTLKFEFKEDEVNNFFKLLISYFPSIQDQKILPFEQQSIRGGSQKVVPYRDPYLNLQLKTSSTINKRHLYLLFQNTYYNLLFYLLFLFFSALTCVLFQLILYTWHSAKLQACNAPCLYLPPFLHLSPFSRCTHTAWGCFVILSLQRSKNRFELKGLFAFSISFFFCFQLSCHLRSLFAGTFLLSSQA